MLNLTKYKEEVERASKESGRRSGRLDKQFVLDLLETIEDDYKLEYEMNCKVNRELLKSSF